ncbi:exodeoxyribonuclease VII large subunit [Paucibacter soli]|uniref:exodeoxyribonuclease VII large subunit n=1 Tax=Paucibacter soli TaxID=3133433 RepID=UPI0030A3E7D5
MDERIYLTTSFKEKDRVKALGARWDPAAGQWYVPAGLDLVPFESWLPVKATGVELEDSLSPNTPSSARELSTQVKGIPLSRLLAGVTTAVARAFSEGIWTTAEVVRASVSKGHYYLELSERNEAGEVVAQTRAVIWARTAVTLLAEFKRATGADLDAGIKVLLRAKPVFKAQFGFSLEVDGIDPSYTLGDLEAKKREIRERLKREGLFDRNPRLAPPWDYSAVLVVAPERAAGLGDFAKEAQRLEAYGICQFSYANSRFQGEGAAAEIVQAIQNGLRTWSSLVLPDAVVIIRGGGSVNDLAWLNNYELARCVCECPVPVLTGVGHERDETSVDEVAHRKFDTPSKVIAGIEDLVRIRAREAKSQYESVLTRARADTTSAAKDAQQLRQHVEHAARSTVLQARVDTESLLNTARHRSVSTIHEARTQSREAFDAVRTEARAQVAAARQSTPGMLSKIGAHATSTVTQARRDVETKLPLVLERASTQTRTMKQEVTRTMLDAFECASRSASIVSDRSQALFREIAGQGPQKTLRRGFAVVRSLGGKTVTTASQVRSGAQIEVRLHDGVVGAVVSGITKSTEGGS